MIADKNAPWTEDEIAIAKSILAMHGQPLDQFNPVRPSEDFMELVRKLTPPQLQWLLMEILSTVRRQTRRPHE
jgi:thioredoxin-like negative regulator of GroEL